MADLFWERRFQQNFQTGFRVVSVSVSVGGFSVWFHGVVSGSGSGLVSGSASVYLDCRGKPAMSTAFLVSGC